MRRISSDELISKLVPLIKKAGVELPKDISKALDNAIQLEEGPASSVLNRCRENLKIAKDKSIPFCQDTGMVIFFVERGEELYVEGGLNGALNKAVEIAYKEGHFRNSVVMDPVKERINSGNNLPPVIHERTTSGQELKVSFLLKGFGSENCCRLHMLKPTEGRQGVINAVVKTMKEAGGSPCPPVVLGVGIGGTMEQAARISKEALLRDLDEPHEDPWYAELEKELTAQVNSLGIGGGGLGGSITALGVKVASYPTHIAGMPVAVSVNCWADRKGSLCL